MSHIEAADVDRIRRALDRERQESLVEERLTDTVIRRRSKSAPPLRTACRCSRRSGSPPPRRARRAGGPRARARARAGPTARGGRAARAAGTRSARRGDAAPAAAAEPVAPPAPVEPVQRRRVVEAPGSAAPERRPRPLPQRRRPSPPRRRWPRAAPKARGSLRPRPPRRRRRPRRRPCTIRTITSPVVTGSAATGAFIQLPGMPPRGEAGVPKIEIKDRDEELRRLGRTGLINRQPAGPRSLRPSGRSARPASAPARRRARRSPPPARRSRRPRSRRPPSTSASCAWARRSRCRDLAQKMGIKGKEVIKKLWALGMMGVNINQDVDLDTATLIATEFGYQIESTAFNEDEVIADAETAGHARGSGAARAGGHHHGPRRPRQDVAARRHPQGQRRRGRGRRHHPAHRRLQGARATAATSSSSTRRATRRSPPCARAARR